MSIVTSTVAACLEAFAVDTAKYSSIGKGCNSLPLTKLPSDEELATLAKGWRSWSRRGAQDSDDKQMCLIASLHALDFVCLSPADGGQLYDVAQIKSIHTDEGKTSIRLAFFKRGTWEERSIVDTGDSRPFDNMSAIKRRCWVDQAGSTDCDFTISSAIEQCQICKQDRMEKAQIKKRLRRPRTLSLFGGAGGVDIGLALSHFKTLWMVDSSEVSCQTFAAHHPGTKVTQLPAGDALLDRVSLPSMPSLDEVDAIVMGPPCQPFSKINRQSREDREKDPRSLCVATGLSYVETYRPTYGLIENVCGILENGNLGKVKGNGIVKFILMCVATLGYTARMGIVQCSCFGIPQTRKRLIILFALEGVTLPEIPSASHGTREQLGLYRQVTIADATSDLPRWDVANSKIFGPSTFTAEEGRMAVPPSYQLCRDGQVKAAEYCQYRSAPQSAFQRQMRVGASQKVADHFVLAPFETPALNVERFWHIPCRPQANHLSLQGLGQLEIPELLRTEDESVFKNAFGWLDSKGVFPIVMTSIGLRTKSGRMLMPDQHRTPSIRELARAQGFPDGIRFKGTPAEQLSQIGNAVPVPLACALGESIVEAMVTDFRRGETRFAKQQ